MTAHECHGGEGGTPASSSIRRLRFGRGITPIHRRADTSRMVWPVAALAVFLLGFVVVYGSRLQARLEGVTGAVHDDSGVDLDIV